MALHKSVSFRSSALLSFDEAANEKLAISENQPSRESAKELAESILRGEASPAQTAQAGPAPPSQLPRNYESHLTLTAVSPTRLRVTWLGNTSPETVAGANGVAQILTSWVPANIVGQQPAVAPDASVTDAPVPTAPAPAVPIQAAHAPQTAMGLNPQETLKTGPSKSALSQQASLKEQTQLLKQIDEIDHTLADLAAQQSRVNGSLQQANAERDRELAARQPLQAQLATAKKRLEDLRARYTDEYPDVETAQDNLADVQSRLAALPPVKPLPATEQASLAAIGREISGLQGDRSQLLQRLIDLQAGETSQRTQPAVGGEAIRQPQHDRKAIASGVSAPTPAVNGKSKAIAAANPNAAQPAPPGNTPTAISVKAPVLRSPFDVSEPARIAEPVENNQYWFLCIGIALGILMFVNYMAIALWWFRPVPGVAALEQLLTPDIAYIGSIPRMIR